MKELPLKVLERKDPLKNVGKGGGIEGAKTRLLMIMIAFLLSFSVICGRLGYLMVGMEGEETGGEVESVRGTRADIVDRNGIVLATSLVTQSLYANPHMVINPEDTARQLVQVFPDLDYHTLITKLKADRGFFWLKRNLTPKQQSEVYALGLPGLAFQQEEKRIYPMGRLFAHVLGCTDIDNRGISGVEKYFNEALLTDASALTLSFDARVQHVLHDEVLKKIKEFNAIGGGGLVLDVNTGEIVAMVSLPDFDPHHINQAKKEHLFNMATLGVYEFGSTMKILTTALALDSGVVTLNSKYDISEPIRVARFRIKDYHPRKIVADIPQIFLHSSNIGMVKMILDVGMTRHKEFLARFGMLEPAVLELPEVGTPLVPAKWREINTMTMAYGYGLSVTSVHSASAIAAIVNGGVLRRPTLLKTDQSQVEAGVRVISEKTSQQMRELLRLVVHLGTGRKARVPGHDVGGKTGTAEKASNGGYRRDNIVSFVGAFPMSSPRYLVIAMVDEPKGNKSSYGFATAGWIAAPLAKNIITRIAPLLGVKPEPEQTDSSSMVEIYKASMKGH